MLPLTDVLVEMDADVEIEKLNTMVTDWWADRGSFSFSFSLLDRFRDMCCAARGRRIAGFRDADNKFEVVWCNDLRDCEVEVEVQ